MVETVTFIAPSGSPASGTVIPALAAGNASGAHFIGFFGAGGPGGVPFAVLVGSYQNRTFITSSSGNNLGLHPFGVKGSGQLTNCKFITANTVRVNENPTVTLLTLPEVSGTLLVRFQSSSSIQTQNGLLRAVNLTATSGVSSETALVANIDIRAAEASKDAIWTQIGGNTAIDNRLFLADRTVANITHDFHVAISASPEAVGRRNDWGLFFYIEFL